MDLVPSSVITAIALSAAAGKNPWVPLGLLFLLAAPESVPGFLMEEPLQASLHEMGSPELLFGLGVTFLIVAILESLADKVPWVERWLVPVSTSWRPFAAVVVAALVGVAAADIPQETTLATISAGPVVGAEASFWWAGSIVAACVVAGAVYGWIATIGKTGTRLVLSLVPVPSLRLAHSFLDDLFAVVASFAGFALGDSVLLAVAAALYLIAGLVFGPILTRLTWIHFRIGLGIARKAIRGATRDGPMQPRTPKWLGRALEARGVASDNATILPGYTYRAPEIGRCRAGYVVLAPGAILFATRILFRPRLLVFDDARLCRLGLATSATTRNVAVVDRADGGALREVLLYLFPAYDDEVLPAIEHGARSAALAQVRASSESARRGLPGYADRESSARYLPPERAGSLRTQALVTVIGAVALGVLSGGVFVPIGTGYALSPFPRRFFAGLAISVYLSLCVVGTFGAAWPVAVLYAVILNALALRDLTRNAIKARVEGFVDRRAFLPPVCERVWVPERGLLGPDDRFRDGDPLPLTDGPWKTVWTVLAQSPPATPPHPAQAA